MLILSKDGRSVINADNSKNIHTSGDGLKLVCEFVNGGASCIAEYDTAEEARIALKMLMNAAKTNNNIFTMPGKQSVQAEVANMRQGYESRRSIDGKKTKGHGGS